MLFPKVVTLPPSSPVPSIGEANGWSLVDSQLSIHRTVESGSWNNTIYAVCNSTHCSGLLCPVPESFQILSVEGWMAIAVKVQGSPLVDSSVYRHAQGSVHLLSA